MRPGEHRSEAEERSPSVTAGAVLADVADTVLADWVRRSVARFDLALSNSSVTADAGEAARLAVMGPLRALLALDIDAQRGTPLTVLRDAVRFPTEVLRGAGVDPVIRDPYDMQAFPDDIYGLKPATWADIHEDLADPGLRWSVAKAFEHRRRHRPGDQRGSSPGL